MKPEINEHHALEREIDKTRLRIENSIHELERRLQPDALIRTIALPVRDNGEEFISNLATKVRANPMPVLVVMTGLAWLMASDSSSRRRPSIDPAMTGGYAGYEDQGTDSSAGSFKRAIGDASAKASDQAHDIAAQLKGKINQAKNAVSTAMDNATGSGQRSGANASDPVAASRYQAGESPDGGRTIAAVATSGVARLYREQPVALGVAALAIGAIAGALLPSTRREDQLLGPQRDQLLAESRQQANDLYEAAKTQVGQQAEKLAEHATTGLGSMSDTRHEHRNKVENPSSP